LSLKAVTNDYFSEDGTNLELLKKKSEEIINTKIGR
jgi:hypothetical protein